MRLQKYGINGQIRNWMKAFLENRKQRVVIRGHESDELDVLSGVPQGCLRANFILDIYQQLTKMYSLSSVSFCR